MYKTETIIKSSYLASWNQKKLNYELMIKTAAD